jgi:hypothetical protein
VPGVVGHDEDQGGVLRAIEFARIKGGKPFDTELPWFKDLLAAIGQPMGAKAHVAGALIQMRWQAARNFFRAQFLNPFSMRAGKGKFFQLGGRGPEQAAGFIEEVLFDRRAVNAFGELLVRDGAAFDGKRFFFDDGIG